MGIIIEKLPRILEKLPGGGVAITTIESILNWSKVSSLWYLLFGTACCAIEMMADMTSPFDFDRFGMIPRGTPRQADLMIVAGTVTEKMAPRIKLLYEQMPDKKYVIAMGSCAISGGIFYDSVSVVKGVDRIIPTDVYVPGCPPRPEALLEGVLKLQEKIKKEKI